jgi:DNA-binding NarL/FixJ family response regulator
LSTIVSGPHAQVSHGGGVSTSPPASLAIPRIGESAIRKSAQGRGSRVLRVLADGLTNEEIGKRLFLSPEVVRVHIQKAMRRLEADTRTQAVALALRQSLIG